MTPQEMKIYLSVCLERKSFVSLEDWKNFLQRFGPLRSCINKSVVCFRNRSNDGIVPWFYGAITRAEAESILRDGDDGTFLVRFSETQPQKFVLVYVKVHSQPPMVGRREIKNVLLTHDPRVGKYGPQSESSSQHKHDSIADFIDSCSSRLRTSYQSPLSKEVNDELKAAGQSSLLGFENSTEYATFSTEDVNHRVYTTQQPSLFAPVTTTSDYGNFATPQLAPPVADGDYGSIRDLDGGGSYRQFNSSFADISSGYGALGRGDIKESYGNISSLDINAYRTASTNPAEPYGHFNDAVVSTNTTNPSSESSNYGHFNTITTPAEVYGHFSNDLGAPPPPLPSMLPPTEMNKNFKTQDTYGQFGSNNPDLPVVSRGPPVNDNVYGQFDQLHQSYEMGVQSTEAQAVAQLNLGMSLYKQTKLQEAIDHFLRAEFFAKNAGATTIEARALGNLGTVYLDRKQPQQAVIYYEKCLALTRKVLDTKREKTILNNLVLACMAANEYEMALKYSHEQLQVTANTLNKQKIASRIAMLEDKLLRL
ncbi:hypothetical protein THRCLA_01196 [Thraustotheca clavata]|uniref:Tetratricopeptide repeat protein 29 n=1 Tax=Thraustotheca clavata TaxID=74557 RepID=A0A1W0A9B1_9STRA|nr:hypothetical protein THRCLA_01196 [Thraustotheca clavata]